MYDQSKFRSAKQDIAYALLYDAVKPADKVAIDFLWKLLRCLVYSGVIEDQDVEYAIKFSSVDDLPTDERSVILAWMKYTGNYYCGEVSHEQMIELRMLHESISMMKHYGEIERIREIADMITS